MLIVGDDLKRLIKEKKLIDNENCFDNTCVTMSMGTKVIKYKKTVDTLEYGKKIPDDCINEINLLENGSITIPSKTSILASSLEVINMPMGYFGLLQTKGSLARLFVSLHFSDGQIDPGFSGCVTYEIFNGSEFNIVINVGHSVGNLYIFKTSTDKNEPYNGKYKNSRAPTIYKPNTDT